MSISSNSHNQRKGVNEAIAIDSHLDTVSARSHRDVTGINIIDLNVVVVVNELLFELRILHLKRTTQREQLLQYGRELSIKGK